MRWTGKRFLRKMKTKFIMSLWKLSLHPFSKNNFTSVPKSSLYEELWSTVVPSLLGWAPEDEVSLIVTSKASLPTDPHFCHLLYWDTLVETDLVGWKGDCVPQSHNLQENDYPFNVCISTQLALGLRAVICDEWKKGQITQHPGNTGWQCSRLDIEHSNCTYTQYQQKITLATYCAISHHNQLYNKLCHTRTCKDRGSRNDTALKDT